MQETGNIMEYDTVALDEEQGAVVIIDQTLLPGRMERICLRTAEEIWNAIYLLKVRGAPAIGVTAALGIYLLAKGIRTEDFEVFYKEFVTYKEYLDSARPTAVNLSWALKRMERVVLEKGREQGQPVEEIRQALRQEDFKELPSKTLADLSGVEGPEIFPFHDRHEWCLVVDRFAEGKGYLPMVTDDLASGEFRILKEEEFHMGDTKKRHGGVILVTEEEYRRLAERFPGTSSRIHCG